ncbi:response regulator transcription factor [Streptomyces longwoodensis]|uniref:response regulator n=1 Tax=Streptomyces longwoodensis TaxID=68231 RepID=UPI002256688F|nr:response regulator transcription factor [Streptomyces longwoodensis]MCX4995655.1 response regulator transcription factor [Streptomyces longwoodensis]WTI45294.1 response regulator transcription factor [Streptomyces longwoodensis]
MREQQTGRPVLRVVVADDNPVVRAGLTALLDGREEVRVVAEASDGREAREMTRRHRPDLVLLDVRMPGMDGLTALPDLVPLAPVLMLTYSGESETVREALRRGAGGYLVHGEFTADQLVAAVRDVVAGRAHLTPTAATAVVGELRGSAVAHAEGLSEAAAPANSRERLSQVQPLVGQLGSPLSAREAEIMDLIATGLNNHQIAAACFISEKTVKNHINRIFAKLHCTTRAEATAKWLGTAPDTTPPSREVG